MKVPQSLQKYQGAPLAADAADNALVKLGTLKSFMARVIAMIPIPGVSLGVHRSKDGDIWYLRGESGAVGNGVVNANGTVTPLTVGGEMPKIDGVRLDNAPAPALALSGIGAEYVVASISGTLTVIDGVLVTAFSVGGVDISIAGTDPGSAGLVSDSGDFSVLMATFVSGVKTYQRSPGDWTLQVCDNGDGSATGVLHLVNPST